MRVPSLSAHKGLPQGKSAGHGTRNRIELNRGFEALISATPES